MTLRAEELQVTLEQEMIQKGHERYKRRQEKLAPSQRQEPHKVITEALPRVSSTIVRYLREDEQRFELRSRPQVRVV